MALRPSPPPGERGSGAWRKKPPRLPVMETGGAAVLWETPQALQSSVQQRADPCPGGRLGLELIVHLQGGVVHLLAHGIAGVGGGSCLASSVSAAATAAFISA